MNMKTALCRLHLCRIHTKHVCSRTVIIVLLILLIQLALIFIFLKDFKFFTVVSFGWLTHTPAPRWVTHAPIPDTRPLYESLEWPARQTLAPTPPAPVDDRTCPMIPPNLRGPVKVSKLLPSWIQLQQRLAGNLIEGGRWKPLDCVARHRVAIIIPYRDRESHLKLFLQHMHSFLQRQQLDYGIYVVELAPGTKFNRAMLMNIGFAEVSKIYNYQCYIFHDVDLYPEDDRNIYSCPESPRHMSVAIDKFNYRLPYPEIFGGVCALNTEDFKLINGFSNKFFGWGGEDDDMYNRIVNKRLRITRYAADIARYTMMSHTQDVVNPQRLTMLYSGKNRWHIDGINSLLYDVISIDLRPLYTRVYVNFDMARVMASDANTVRRLPDAT